MSATRTGRARRLLPPLVATLLALAALAAVIGQLNDKPRYDAFSRVWLINPSGSSYSRSDVEWHAGRALVPATIADAVRVTHAAHDPAAVPAHVRFEVDADGLLHIHAELADPQEARDVATVLGNYLVSAHPNSKLIPADPPEQAIVRDLPAAHGWRLLAALLLVAAGLSLLTGVATPLLGERRRGLAAGAVALAGTGLWLSTLTPHPGVALAAAGVALAGALAATGWTGLLLLLSTAAAVQGGPFVRSIPAGRFDLVQAGALGLAAAACAPAALTAWRRRPAWALAAAAGALPAWAILSAAWSSMPGRSASQGVVFLAHLGCFLLIALGRWRDRERVARDLGALVISVVVPVAVGLAAWAAGAHWPLSPVSHRFQSLYYNPNALGLLCSGLAVAALALGIASGRAATRRRAAPSRPPAGQLEDEAGPPSFAGERPKSDRTAGPLDPATPPSDHRAGWAGGLAWGLGVAMLGAAILLSGSRGALLGMVTGMLVTLLLVLPRRWALGVGAALLAVVAAVIVGTRNAGTFVRFGELFFDSGRLDLWRQALARWRERPLLGWGFRTGNADGPGYTFHNVYLSTLAELGIVGLLLLVLLVVVLARRGAGGRPALVGALLAIGVAEIFDSNLIGMFGPATAACWLLLFAYAQLGDGRIAEPGATAHRGRRRHLPMGGPGGTSPDTATVSR